MTLLQCLIENELKIPNYQKCTLVDMLRCIYQYCGHNYKTTYKIEKIKSLIPNNNHIILVLVDGMGSNLIEKLPDSYLLKSNKKIGLITVNPATTGAALTSVATGEYPANHGTIGWYSFNREKNIEFCPVTFTSRVDNIDLGLYDISENDVYRCESVMNKLKRKTYAFFPKDIVNSKFSKFTLLEDNSRIGYENIRQAFSLIIDNLMKEKEKTFSYLYIPDVDSYEHKYGINSRQVNNVLNEIENELRRIQKLNISDLTMVITADHGQTNVELGDVVMDFVKYQKYFYALPGIDLGMATYYIKSGKEEDFEQEFRKDFYDRMFLYKTEEFLKHNIFGNEGYSQHFNNSIGEYISFCKKGYYFVNSTDVDKYLNKVKGNHSGLSSDEVEIPLIII